MGENIAIKIIFKKVKKKRKLKQDNSEKAASSIRQARGQRGSRKNSGFTVIIQ